MIYLGGTILNEFASIYYNDKNDSFEMMFQIYTYSSVNNIYHPEIVEEFKANMYKADYEDNLQKGVYLPSENIKLDRGMNEYH